MLKRKMKSIALSLLVVALLMLPYLIALAGDATSGSGG